MVVERTGPLAVLDRSEPGGVVVIVAGGGSGKTTLVRQWASRLSTPTAYLALTSNLASILPFGRALTAELVRALPPDEQLSELHWRAHGSSPDWPQVLLPRLLRMLSASDITLILDDVHLLEGSSAIEAVQQIVRHRSSRGRSVLVGRDAAWVGVPALRAQGRLTLLSEHSLTFDEVEATQAVGRSLSSEAIRSVIARTAGLPAGLRLEALEGVDDNQRATFAGEAPQSVRQFLDEEVFSTLSASQIEFLEGVAAISPASAEVCDAALGRSDSESQLLRLSQAFVPMLDISHSPTVVTMHDLLVEDLLERTTAGRPQAVRETRTAAAKASRRNGDLGRAFDYYRASGDTDAFERFVYGQAPRLAFSGRQAILVSWLDLLPATDDESPAITAARMLAAAACGDIQSATQWGERLRKSHDVTLPNGTTAGALATMIEQFLGIHAIAGNAGPTLSAHAVVGPIDELVFAWNDYAYDRVAAARKVLLGLGPSLQDMPIINGSRVAMLALIDAHFGDWASGRDHIELASQIYLDCRLDDHPLTFLPDALTAKFAIHAGDYERALLFATKSRARLARLGGTVARRVVTLLELAKVYLALGDRRTATMVLTECDAAIVAWPGATLLHRELHDTWVAVRRSPIQMGRYEPLSSAELRVLAFLPSHYSMPQIAKKLYIAPSTVRTQVLAVYRKLHVNSRTEAVAVARDLGLVDV